MYLESQNSPFNILALSPSPFLFICFLPGARSLRVVLTWLWLWGITLWHWIMQINFCSNQSSQGLLSKSDGVISSFSALFFLLESSELKLPMSVVACQICVWCKELLGLLLFMTKCPLTHRNMNSLLCVQIPHDLESVAAFVAVSPALGSMQQQDHQVSGVIHCGVAHAWHSKGGGMCSCGEPTSTQTQLKGYLWNYSLRGEGLLSHSG